MGRWFGAGWIVTTVEVSGDRQAGLSSGGSDEVEDFVVAVERFTGPVFGDFGEEAMLDGVPLGSARRVMGNGKSETERVGQLGLELGFPGTAAIAVAAAGVAEDEELTGSSVAELSLVAPPVSDGVSGKGGGVMRDADDDGTSIGEEIIDAVGDGDAGGIGAEVVIIDRARRQVPSRTWILEVTDQFALLGVDADDGEAAVLEAVPKIADIEKLIVTIGAEVGG